MYCIKFFADFSNIWCQFLHSSPWNYFPYLLCSKLQNFFQWRIKAILSHWHQPCKIWRSLLLIRNSTVYIWLYYPELRINAAILLSSVHSPYYKAGWLLSLYGKKSPKIYNLIGSFHFTVIPCPNRYNQRELNKRPTLFYFLGPSKPLPSYGSASLHRRYGVS